MNIPGLFKITDFLNMPSFAKKTVDAQYDAPSDKAPNLTIGDWLRTQPQAIQREEGIKMLQKFGILKS